MKNVTNSIYLICLILFTGTLAFGQAPTFTSSPNTTIYTGNQYNYIITTTDPNGDQVTITAPTKPSWLTLDNSSIGNVSTIAGSGGFGSVNGNGASASFFLPTGVARDASGNIYVADRSNNKIRKITPNGDVTTLAGNGGVGDGDANGISASFNSPQGVAVDATGNVFVADYGNNKIRKIAPNGDVTTLAGVYSGGSTDANGINASFNRPSGVAVDALGNVYVADASNNKIRKITPNGDVTTVAGSGLAGSTDANGVSASFYTPSGIDIDNSGNIYVADAANNKIRKINSNGDVTTIAGSGVLGSIDGAGTSATFNSPIGVAVDDSGNVYVADQSNHNIRKILSNGKVITLAGLGTSGSVNGNSSIASFYQPWGIAVDASGYVYVADTYNSKIRKISPLYQLIGDATGNAGSYNVSLSANDGNGGTTQQNFTISVNEAVILTTNAANIISANSAILNGNITSDQGATITERGFVYSLTSADPTPTLAESSGGSVTKVVVSGTTGPFSKSLLGLTSGTSYSYSAYAINSNGSSQGPVITFTPTNTAPVFTSTPITSIVEGDTYAYTIASYDPNGDNVSLTAPTKPAWLNLTNSPGGNVTTLAGTGFEGGVNANGTNASFIYPNGICVDQSGNKYVTDGSDIRKITPNGDVTTLAGSGSTGSADGNGVNASFNGPFGIAVDASGFVYVADRNNHKIRKIAPNGDVTTLAGSGISGNGDGNGVNASFSNPLGIAVDNLGNVYVGEATRIRKITPNGDVTTFAGSSSSGSTDGNGTNASFNGIWGLAVDVLGFVYVADFNNHKIRKVAPNGDVTTLAGSGTIGWTDGNGTSASFYTPTGVAVDASRNVYVAQPNNYLIRKIDANGNVTTLAGTRSVGSTDAFGIAASFNEPIGIASDASGNVFITDRGNYKIRKIAGPVVQLVGNSSGNFGIHNVVLQAADGNGGVTQQSFSVSVTKAPSITTTVATSIEYNSATLNGTVTSDGLAAITERGFVYSLTSADATPTLSEASGSDVTKVVVSGTSGGLSAILSDLSAKTSYSFSTFATNSVGTTEGSILTFNTSSTPPIFSSEPVTSIDPGNIYIYPIIVEDPDGDEVTITASTKPSWLNLVNSIGGDVSTLAGSGSLGSTDANGAGASFYSPSGVAVDAFYNVYVTDQSNHKIRKISPSGDVTTLAGSGSAGSADGNGTSASFNTPWGLAVDASNNIYVADLNNSKIRKITPDGNVTTLAGSGSPGSADGNGTNASFNRPSGVAVDASGNVYVADQFNNKIRKITPSGEVTTLAGSGSTGSTDDNGINASFDTPWGVAVDALGNVFVADYGNNKIRKINTNGDVTTLAGSGSAGSGDGIGTNASFNIPRGVTVDASGNVYVADQNNNKIRVIAPNGTVTTLAGSGNAGSADSNGLSASFNSPTGVAVDVVGNVYVADLSNHKIRKILGVYIQLSGNTTGNEGSHSVVLEANDGNGAIAQQSFIIEVNDVPAVTTAAPTDISLTSVTLNGEATSLSGAPITERGFVYSITSADATPTLAESGGSDVTKVIVSGTNGNFSEVLSNLATATSYSYSAYATNRLGTTEGSVITVTTLDVTINISPTFTSTPSTAIKAGNIYNYIITTKDLNGDQVSISAPTLPSWLSLVPNAGADVTTVAGSGVQGSAEGNGASASFNSPRGVAIDGAGNVIVADPGNHKIRKIAPNGDVTTLAGSGSANFLNGNGTSARFSTPSGVVLDNAGNIYVADQTNHRIRKITPNGDVTTFAGTGSTGSVDGIGTIATFYNPIAIAIDAANNLYVADYITNKIRKITPNGDVTTIAGSGSAGSADGNGANASFNRPMGVAVDVLGNVYVGDQLNHKIRKITPNGDVTTLAGSGSPGSTNANGIAAKFTNPAGVAVDASGNVYVADANNNKIRKIDKNGDVTTFAGSTSGSTDANGTSARFNSPQGLAFDATGNLYVADQNNHKIRKITGPSVRLTGNSTGNLGSHNVLLEANDGNGGVTEQSFDINVIDEPTISTLSASGIGLSGATLNGEIYSDGGGVISERGFVYSLTSVDATPTFAESSGSNVTKIIVDGTVGAFDQTIVGLTSSTIYSFTAYVTNAIGTTEGSTVTFMTLNAPPSFTSTPVTTIDAGDIYSYAITTIDDGGNVAITAPTLPSWLSVLTRSSGDVTTLAGSGSSGNTNGNGTNASFNQPSSVVMDVFGNVYVADVGNNKIRKISPNGNVSNFAGSGNVGSVDGIGESASFNGPHGLTIDASGNIYVGDSFNNKIRKITPNGIVTTLAGSGSIGSANGNGTSASFNAPRSVIVDASGNVYVADYGNNRIRKIAPNGDVTTIAGTGSSGSTNGNGTIATFNGPAGVSIDESGSLYVADRNSNKIRKITPDGIVSTVAGSGNPAYADGIGSAASFYAPVGITVDAFGNLFIADQSSHKIRQITPDGQVSTLAGSNSGSVDGNGTNARFNNLTGVTVTTSGDLYVADFGNHKIRKIGAINTLIGNSTGQVGNHNVVLEAKDGNGGITQQSFTVIVNDVLLVNTEVATEINSNSVTLNGDVTSDGGFTVLERGFVYSLTSVDPTPTLAESSGSNVIKVVTTGTTGIFSKSITNLASSSNYSFAAYAINSEGTKEGSIKSVTTLNGAPLFTSTPVTSINVGSSYSYTITANDPEGNNIIVTAPTKPGWLSLINNLGGDVTTFAGSGSAGSINANGINASFNNPSGVIVDVAGNVYVADRNNKIRKITPNGDVINFAGSGTAGSENGIGESASFNGPVALDIDASGNIYVADAINHKIRKIAPNGVVTTIAGSGSAGSINANGTSASFDTPVGVAVDASGNLYVADSKNNKIRKIAPNGDVTTLAGSGNQVSTDGNGTSASFDIPSGIAVDAWGFVYVADRQGCKIRKIAPNGNVTTLAGSGNQGSADGNGTSASFKLPICVTVDPAGNVFVGDSFNHKIRKIAPNGDVTTFAGTGSAGSMNGNGTSASFNYPAGIAIAPTGDIYVADQLNHKIRKITGPSFQLTGNSTGNVGSHPVVLEANDGNGGVKQQSFTIVVNDVPAVTTIAASAISANGATLNGEVTSDGGTAITERGFVYSLTSADATPTLAESSGSNVTKVVVAGTTGAFDADLINLTLLEEYSFAAYATNSLGTKEGAVLTFIPQDLPAPTITFGDINKTYGDADFVLGATSNSSGAITYSIVGGANGTSLSGSNNQTVSLGNAGTVTIRATQAANELYSATTKDITLTIETIAITITANTGQAKTFGTSDPTFAYAVSAGSLATGDSFTGFLSRVTGENVGTYPITIGTLSAGTNYNLTFVGADFNISAKAITVTASSGQTKIYGSNEPTFAYTITAGSLESGDSFSGALSRIGGENVGFYAILIGTLSAGTNYNLSFISADFEITAKAISVSANSGQSKVYGLSDPTFGYTITAGSLQSGDSFSGVLSRAAGENVGSYSITIGTLSAGSNYNLTFIGADFEITARAITITASAGQSKVYGFNDPIFEYTITAGSLESGDAFSGALSRSSGENVGSYTIMIGTLSAGTNYNLTFAGADFSITSRSITVTTNAGQSKVYGASDPNLAFTVSAGSLATGDSFTGSLSRGAGEEVGTYAITLGTLSAGINYNLTFIGADFNISAKAITVTANTGQTKGYGETDPTFTYTVSEPLASGDSFSGLLSRASGENAGNYSITLGTLSAGTNYNLTFVGADFSISKVSITVAADGGMTKVYGDMDPTFTYAVTNGTLKMGDSFSGALSRTIGENVGIYSITLGSLSAGINYNVTLVTADFSITSRAIAVSANAGQTKVYGTSDPTFAFAVSVGSLAAGDSFTGSLSRGVGEDVGTYAITLGTLSAGINYNLTFIGADFIVSAREITVTANAGQVKIRGGADPVLTFAVTTGSLAAGDSFTGSLSRVAGESVGTYPITLGTLAVGLNYNITFVSSDFIITEVLGVDDELKKENMLVFSSGNTLIVRMDYQLLNADVSIYNLNGKLIRRSENVDFNGNDWTTQFSERGLFIVTVQSGNTALTKKFIKE